MQGSRTRRPDPVHLEPGLQLGNVTGGAERGVRLHRPDERARAWSRSLFAEELRGGGLQRLGGQQRPPHLGRPRHPRRPQRHRAQATRPATLVAGTTTRASRAMTRASGEPWSIRSIGLRLSPPPRVRSSGRSRRPRMRAPRGSVRAIDDHLGTSLSAAGADVRHPAWRNHARATKIMRRGREPVARRAALCSSEHTN
jgi:hypothetical protein